MPAPPLFQTGILQLGSSTALPVGNAVVIGSVSSGTLDLNGFSATVSSLTISGAATGNTVTSSQGTPTLTFAGAGISNLGNPDVFSGTLAGSLGLAVNSGFLALTGANTYTGATTVNGGTLSLAFQTGSQTNIISSSSNLMLGGGVLAVQGASSGPNSQQFSSTTLNAGASQVQALPNTTTPGSLAVTLGAVNRNVGGTVDFVLPSGAQSSTNGINVTAGNSGGILGGYATVSGNTWAVSGGTVSASGPITGLPLSSYATTFATGTNVDVQGGTATLGAGTTTINSLRFNNTGAAYQVTIGSGNSLAITSGGILETAAVGNFGVAIGVSATTATLTSGNGADLIVIQNNPSNSMTINAQITGSIGLTKSGAGTLVLSNAGNNYTGATYINAGTLSVNSSGVIPSGANIVFSGGTLQVTTAPVSFSNNVTLNPNGGTVDTTNQTVTLGGAITGSGSLTVTSSTTAGTLVLSSGSNTYTGSTNIQFGTLQLGTGGVLPTGTAVVLGLSNGGSLGTTTLAGTLDLNGNNATIGSLNTSGLA